MKRLVFLGAFLAIVPSTAAAEAEETRSSITAFKAFVKAIQGNDMNRNEIECGKGVHAHSMGFD